MVLSSAPFSFGIAGMTGLAALPQHLDLSQPAQRTLGRLFEKWLERPMPEMEASDMATATDTQADMRSDPWADRLQAATAAWCTTCCAPWGRQLRAAASIRLIEPAQKVAVGRSR